MILTLLSISPPLLLGLVIVRLLIPDSRDPLLLFSLAVGLGFGLSSCLVFVWLLTVGSDSRGITAVEVLAVIVGTLLIVRRQSTRAHLEQIVPAPRSTYLIYMERALLLALIVLLVIVAARYVLSLYAAPHGYFDAWESWNMKARVVFLSGKSWREAFKSITDIVPDYPLSLPLSIAGIWATMGNDSTLVPQIVAAFYLLATVALLLSGLSKLRSRSQGLIACILLLGTPFFVHLSYAQYADIPLGFLMLATVVHLALYDSRPDDRGLLVLAGLTAGLSCWMKNEGLLFTFFLITCYFFFTWREEGRSEAIARFLRLGGGAIVPCLVLLSFRIGLAGSNAFLAQQGAHSIAHKLRAPHLYLAVLKAVRPHVLDNFGDWRLDILLVLAVYAILVGVQFKPRHQAGAKSAVTIVVIMLGFYFLTFVASPFSEAPPPFGLNWFVLVTIQRLLMQIWPCLIFAFFMFGRTPDQAIATFRAYDTQLGLREDLAI
jgi:hypothetical protein